MSNERIDPYSSTWLAIREHAQRRIEELVGQNETEGLPPDKTENIRGRIAELRQILRLPLPEPPIPDSMGSGEFS